MGNFTTDNKGRARVRSSSKAPRYAIETAHEVAARFGGKFVDPEFKGMKHRHNWETRDGMPFERSLESILTQNPSCLMTPRWSACAGASFKQFSVRPSRRPAPLFLRTTRAIRDGLDPIS